MERIPPTPVRLTAAGGDLARRTQPTLDILVIEDNDDFRSLMVDLLRLDGHEVRAAADGLSGLRLAMSDADLIFVDIHLPGIDGYGIARTVRAGGCEGYMVAMTGFGQSRDRATAVAAGFDDYIVKPARKPVIDAAIGRAARAQQARVSARSQTRHRRASSRVG